MKSIKLSNYFQLVHPHYTILRILPIKSNKNYHNNQKKFRLKTLEKYDGIQLSRALILLQNGSYEAFTNDDNVRNNLSLFINKDNASKIIHRILEDSGYSVSSDEEVWLFMEMISKMSLERKCDNGKNRI